MEECVICSTEVPEDAQIKQSCSCTEKKCICHECYIRWQKRSEVQTPELCMYCRTPHKDKDTLFRDLLARGVVLDKIINASKLLTLCLIYLAVPLSVTVVVAGFPKLLLALYCTTTAAAKAAAGLSFPAASTAVSFVNRKLASPEGAIHLDVCGEELDYFIRTSWARLTTVVIVCFSAYFDSVILYFLLFLVTGFFIGTIEFLRGAVTPEHPFQKFAVGIVEIFSIQLDYIDLAGRFLRKYSVYGLIVSDSMINDYMLSSLSFRLCRLSDDVGMLSGGLAFLFAFYYATQRQVSFRWAMVSFWAFLSVWLEPTHVHDVLVGLIVTFASYNFYPIFATLILIKQMLTSSKEEVSSISFRIFMRRCSFQD